jgi:anaerobic selenocysteine-containing dehydrogenase
MPKIDRRDFLKLVGVSAGAAATGCADPTEQLIPYVIQPEELTPGIALTYASSCQECGAGCGIHVKTREGRPIKLEGNPQHPVNKGTLCSRGQVALGWTYHPDRWNGPLSNGESVAWDGSSFRKCGSHSYPCGVARLGFGFGAQG